MDREYCIGRLPEDQGRVALSGVFSPEGLNEHWQALEEAHLDQFPWGGEYRPDCRARVGWNAKGIHVLLYAHEAVIKAEEKRIGGLVCLDSCLEFFLTPNPEGCPAYINCESNPQAVLHIGIGEQRKGREVIYDRLPEGVCPCHSEHAGGWWAVSFTLPAGFLREKTGCELKPGAAMRGNFYSCGGVEGNQHYCMFYPYDDLPKPDYHRPERFAAMYLGK